MRNFKRWIDMHAVASTYEILYKKHLNESVDEKWSDWAIEMMQAGYETESLSMLALLEKPVNSFEMKELTDRIFLELELDHTDEKKVSIDYASYLIMRALKGDQDVIPILEKLGRIYWDLNENNLFVDFYLLNYAKQDLLKYEVQNYWKGCDPSNIDAEILRIFKEWISQYPI